MPKIFTILAFLTLFIFCGRKEQRNGAPVAPLPPLSANPAETGPTKPEPVELYVGVKAGLFLRETPGQKGKIIRLLPRGTRLDTRLEYGPCETIYGDSGCWSKYQVGRDKGWVYGSFYLTSYKPLLRESEFDHLSEQHCEGIKNSCQCQRRVEEKQLARHPNVRRQKHSLAIALDSGKVVNLPDEPDRDGGYLRKYYFQSRVRDYYVFQVCQNEVGIVKIMHARTGTTEFVLNEPIYSPSGKYFATFAHRPMFGRDGVQIFEIKGDTHRKAFEDETSSGWVPQHLQWESDELVRLKVRLSDSSGYTSTDTDLKIRRADGTWKIGE